MTNLILWRKTRAQHKQLIKKHKQDSWKQFTETLQRKAHPSTVHEALRRIEGSRAPRKICILQENNQTYSQISDIANRLAQTFSDIAKIKTTRGNLLNILLSKFLERIGHYRHLIGIMNTIEL